MNWPLTIFLASAGYGLVAFIAFLEAAGNDNTTKARLCTIVGLLSIAGMAVGAGLGGIS